MKLSELKSRTAKFLRGITVRKIILLIFTLGILVCAFLGGFYYQLLLNTGMVTLISLGAIALMLFLTLICKLKVAKDNYYRFIINVFAVNCDTKEFKNRKALMSRIDEALKTSLKGYEGYKQALIENKVLLSYMLTDCIAFEKYANKGIRTKVSSFFLRFVFAPFKYFAIVDMLMSAQTNNAMYRVLSSTRWYQCYSRYSGGIGSWLLRLILPFVLWLILGNIATSILTSIFDISSILSTMINFGVLCVILQLNKFFGLEKLFERLALDFKSANIPAANYDICLAFADVSDGYRKICVDNGYIQTTQVKGY